MSHKTAGVYHAAGDDRVNRYEFAVKIAQTFGLDSSFLTPVNLKDPEAWIAKRPKDSSLCVDKLKMIGIQPLRLTQALTRMKSARA
jgi:dTDP-4-dehydrorhamnose reductase